MVFFWTWLGERRPRHLVKNHLNKIKNHPKFVPKWCRNGSKSVPRSRVGGLRRPGWPKRRQNLQKLVRGPSFWIPWDTLSAAFGHPGTVFRPSDLQNQMFFRRPISGSHFVSILGALRGGRHAIRSCRRMFAKGRPFSKRDRFEVHLEVILEPGDQKPNYTPLGSPWSTFG